MPISRDISEGGKKVLNFNFTFFIYFIFMMTSFQDPKSNTEGKKFTIIFMYYLIQVHHNTLVIFFFFLLVIF